MIKINKSTKAGIKAFNASQWVASDVKYYGKDTNWIEEEFVFKADEDGKIVGTIFGKFAAGVLYIDDLIVAKDKRGLGIGRRLMRKAEGFGNDLKAHKIYLITGKDWDVGEFYEKLGFVNKGEFKNHYHKSNFVIYEKYLSN